MSWVSQGNEDDAVECEGFAFVSRFIPLSVIFSHDTSVLTVAGKHTFSVFYPYALLLMKIQFLNAHFWQSILIASPLK